MKRSSLPAQTERRGDAGPVRLLLGGGPSPATFVAERRPLPRCPSQTVPSRGRSFASASQSRLLSMAVRNGSCILPGALGSVLRGCARSVVLCAPFTTLPEAAGVPPRGSETGDEPAASTVGNAAG